MTDQPDVEIIPPEPKARPGDLGVVPSNKLGRPIPMPEPLTRGPGASAEAVKRKEEERRFGGGKRKFRPRADLKAAAREFSMEALALLVGTMRNRAVPTETRIKAANHVLDRAYGKPKESLDIRRTLDLSGMTLDELVTIGKLFEGKGLLPDGWDKDLPDGRDSRTTATRTEGEPRVGDGPATGSGGDGDPPPTG